MASGGRPSWPRQLLEDDVLRPCHGEPFGVPDDAVIVLADGEVVWANATASRDFAPLFDEADGPVELVDLLREEDRDEARAVLESVASGRQAQRIVQLPIRRVDGWRTYLWRVVDRRRDPGVDGVALLGHDVSPFVGAAATPRSFDAWWSEVYASSEPMIAVDEHNDVVAANAAAEALFAPADPQTGWRTIRHPDLLLLAFVDVNVVRPGRDVVRVRPVVTRVQAADGGGRSLIWLRDVTFESGRRRQLDRSAHRWSHVLEALPDPVFLVLRSGEVEFTNVAGEQLVERIIGTRHEEDEIVHLDVVLDAFDGPRGGTVRRLLADTLADGEARGPAPVTIRHAPSGPVELLVRTEVLQVGDETLAVLAARDVTVERQAIRQVEQLNVELRAAVAASELARVAERERVARAIHDDTLQRLTVLRWLLSDAVPRGLDAAAVTELDELIVALRDVMTSLHSPVRDLGLPAALQQLALQTVTPVTVRCRAAASRVPVHVAELAFRSVREALRNVDAHAQARAATVDVTVAKGVLRACVRDDGRGASAEEVAAAARAGHLGVVSVRESVLAEGGTFELSSNTRGNPGTTLTFTIPLRS